MSLPSRSSLHGLLLASLILLCSTASPAQTETSLAGSVRDPGGSAMAGIALTLSPDSPPNGASDGGSAPTPLHATTDTRGAFHFDGVPFGSYHLSSDPSAGVLAPATAVVLSAQAPTLRLDLTLSHPAALQLQAAGIRGYIDPGGYSAPASAAAATDLVRGVGDLNRPASEASQPADSACLLELQLLQAVAAHPDDAAANRALGEFYLAHHQPKRAIPALQRAWDRNNSDETLRMALAEALLQNKDFRSAHDLLLANGTQPATAALDRLLARSEEGLGEFAEASRDYQSAAALEPTEADVYGAGYELLLAGSPGAASKVFLAGATRYPQSTMLLVGMGTAAFLQGKSEEATRTFLRAADLHPADPRAYPFLSASFGISGTEPEAVQACFRRYHELAPGSAEAAYFDALSLLRHGSVQADGNLDEVQSLLQRAIELDPTLANAHVQMGSLYLDRGNPAQAAGELATALRLDPDLWDVHYKLSAAYRRAGRTQQAEQQMRLFLTRKRQEASGDQASQVHLDQFLSVLKQPQGERAAQPPCAAPDR